LDIENITNNHLLVDLPQNEVLAVIILACEKQSIAHDQEYSSKRSHLFTICAGIYH